mgnify:CR=1 FL=1
MASDADVALARRLGTAARSRPPTAVLDSLSSLVQAAHPSLQRCNESSKGKYLEISFSFDHQVRSATAVSLAIAGCGDESDDLPVDGREFDGVTYSERAPYQGRVIDGYLNNARVWLDLDDNGQYTVGPVEIELDSGNTHILEDGEPTVMSGPGGRFSMDVSALDVPPSIGANLDPRDYPLYALAIPGQTLEELYEHMAWPLYEKFGHCFEAFKLMVTNPDQILDSLKKPDGSPAVDAAVKESGGDEATARAKIAQIVSDTTNKAVFSATAALRAKLLQDETVQTVAMLEPVALDVTKVVDAAVKGAGGDEMTARSKIAQIVSDTTNEAVTAIAALRGVIIARSASGRRVCTARHQCPRWCSCLLA